MKPCRAMVSTSLLIAASVDAGQHIRRTAPPSSAPFGPRSPYSIRLDAMVCLRVVCAWALCLVPLALARETSPHAINAKRHAASNRIRDAMKQNAMERREEAATVKNITFSNPKASGQSPSTCAR
jgi:hypothetical protein